MRLRVVVTPKEEVVDSAGEAVSERVSVWGFSDVQSVRIGKVIDVEINAADRDNALSRLKQMCSQLLVNSRTEDFEIIDLDEV